MPEEQEVLAQYVGWVVWLTSSMRKMPGTVN